MKTFNLLVKIAAFALIIYVFMQQKNDYYAEMRGKAATAHTPVVEKAKTPEAALNNKK